MIIRFIGLIMGGLLLTCWRCVRKGRGTDRWEGCTGYISCCLYYTQKKLD